MKVPKNKVRIGDVCKFSSGNGFGPKDWKPEGLPIIRIQNLNGSREFNYFDGATQDDWIIEPGDLLFAWAGVKGVSFGPTIWSGPRGVLNQHIYRIRPNRGVDLNWLNSALMVVTTRIEAKAHGFKSSLVHVRKSDITDELISFPPLPEQRRIAEILGSWDRAIETQQKLITAKTNRLRSLRHHLLTGSRRFPEFQGKWRKFYLGDLLLEEERYVDWNDADTYNLVSVRRRSGGVFFRESLKGSQIKTKVMKSIHAGDFLIARMQAVHGAIAVVPEAHDGKHVSDSYNTLKPRDSETLDIHFFGWLSTLPQFYRLIRISSHGVVIEKMTFDLADFLKRSVTIPPTKAEQTRIAIFLNAAQHEITLLTNQLEALKQQKRGLMQQLLTGEIRVPI